MQKTSAFRLNLSQIMEQQRATHPDLPVPFVLKFLVDVIMDHNGLETVGIFRKSVESDLLASTKSAIERGDYDTIMRDPILAACLIKQWMKDIKEPIVPSKLYNTCIASANSDATTLNQLILQFPVENREVIYFLFAFLRQVAASEPVNKMSPMNLAIVISPNFCRCPDINALLVNTKLETEFVFSLLTKLHIPNSTPPAGSNSDTVSLSLTAKPSSARTSRRVSNAPQVLHVPKVPSMIDRQSRPMIGARPESLDEPAGHRRARPRHSPSPTHSASSTIDEEDLVPPSPRDPGAARVPTRASNDGTLKSSLSASATSVPLRAQPRINTSAVMASIQQQQLHGATSATAVGSPRSPKPQPVPPQSPEARRPSLQTSKSLRASAENSTPLPSPGSSHAVSPSVQPAAPSRRAQYTVIALGDFRPTNPLELQLVKDRSYEVYAVDEAGHWYQAGDSVTKKEGWIPVSWCSPIRPLDKDNDSNSSTELMEVVEEEDEGVTFDGRDANFMDSIGGLLEDIERELFGHSS